MMTKGFLVVDCVVVLNFFICISTSSSGVINIFNICGLLSLFFWKTETIYVDYLSGLMNINFLRRIWIFFYLLIISEIFIFCVCFYVMINFLSKEKSFDETKSLDVVILFFNSSCLFLAGYYVNKALITFLIGQLTWMKIILIRSFLSGALFLIHQYGELCLSNLFVNFNPLDSIRIVTESARGFWVGFWAGVEEKLNFGEGIW